MRAGVAMLQEFKNLELNPQLTNRRLATDALNHKAVGWGRFFRE